MRLVTEQELKDIEQGVTKSDIWAGIVVGVIMGLVYWGALMIGVG